MLLDGEPGFAQRNQRCLHIGGIGPDQINTATRNAHSTGIAARLDTVRHYAIGSTM